jgi:transcription elongation factor Elf1
LETGGFIYPERANDEIPMSASEEFTFDCPSCGASMAVNASMRDALVENGCVVCGASVTAEAFSSSGQSPDK